MQIVIKYFDLSRLYTYGGGGQNNNDNPIFHGLEKNGNVLIK
jgi:hypothetical protein